MGWPEVTESGALKLTWVKMDGLMRQLQKGRLFSGQHLPFHTMYKAAKVTTLPI